MTAGKRALVSALGLLLVAIAVVAFAWFGVERRDATGRARRDAEERIFSFRPGDVTAFTVAAKVDVTRLVRAGEGWRLEAPVRADADRGAVDALVERVAGLRRKAVVADAASPQPEGRYGLAHPRVTVDLTLADGHRATLALGDDNAFDGTLYVRDGAGTVSVVPGDLRWAVERGAFDLREKRLLRFEPKEAERIEVATPRLSYALVRAGADAWRLESPVREEADGAAVGRLLDALAGLRATAFTAAGPGEAPPAAGGAARRWSVTVVVRGQAPVKALLWSAPRKPGADAGKATGTGPLLARVEGSSETASVPQEVTADLDLDLAALRAKHAADHPPGAATTPAKVEAPPAAPK